MAQALTPAVLVASLVLIAAGGAKLRAPGTAAEAMATLGLRAGGPGGRALIVRGVALTEIGLGAATVAGVTPFLLAGTYAAFALAAAALLRARAECGCFGEAGTPGSAVHVALNAVLAGVSLAAGLAGSRGLEAVVALPATQVIPATLGILAAATAAVLSYVELPRAWQAWGGAAG